MAINKQLKPASTKLSKIELTANKIIKLGKGMSYHDFKKACFKAMDKGEIAANIT